MNASASNADNENDNNNKKRASDLIKKYYRQLTEGCGTLNCTNTSCASSLEFKRLSNEEAAALSIKLARQQNQDKLCMREPMDIDEHPKEHQQQNKQQSQVKSLNDQLQEAVRFVTQITQDSATHVHPNGSYLTEEKLKILVEKCKTTLNFKPLIETLEKGYQDLGLLSISFQKTQENETQSLFNIDFESLRRTNAMLNSLSICDDLSRSLNNAINTICNVIKLTLAYKKDVSEQEMHEILYSLLIINELSILDDPTYMDSCAKCFYSTMSELPDGACVKLIQLWSKWSVLELRGFLNRVQQYITLCVVSKNLNENESTNDEEASNEVSLLHKNVGVTGAISVIRLIYYASILGGRLDDVNIINKERELEENDSKDYYQPQEQDNPLTATNHKLNSIEELLQIRPIDCRQSKLDSQEFINEVVNDALDIQHDYVEYKQLQQYVNILPSITTRHQTKNFSFLAHPYVLTLSKKNLGLYFDNKIKMLRERRQNIMHSLFEGLQPNPYFKIRVSRSNVLYEALSLIEIQEMEDPSILRKQLFIEFENEQGIDEGGVSKEFFQLALDELMNKGYTFFKYDQTTRLFWFDPCTLESEKEFKLVGTLFGIAIYNNVILDVQFPLVFFRKLMGKLGTFEDLKESHPTLYNSLVQILEYEDDNFEDTFYLSFRIELADTFGNQVSFDLIDNGDKVSVTKENRQQFVNLYTDFILNKSIEDKFRAFKCGFMNVTRNSPLLKWYLPSELEMLLCGTTVLDWNSLQMSTNYDGGFTAECEYIRNFWQLFDTFSDEQKQQLLKFTTGTDRCPHGGLAEIKLTISRNGPDTDRLPTAHTCFNILLLPEYSSVEKLREKLLIAIQNSSGFGLR